MGVCQSTSNDEHNNDDQISAEDGCKAADARPEAPLSTPPPLARHFAFRGSGVSLAGARRLQSAGAHMAGLRIFAREAAAPGAAADEVAAALGKRGRSAAIADTVWCNIPRVSG